jgi:hypothetical protein
MNLGGTVLKTLFGTATMSDICQLHDILEELKSGDTDIVHSLSKQLTCIKKLGATSEINIDAIADLSSIVKDNIIKLHDRFQQITKDLFWLNITIHGQSELVLVVKTIRICFVVS